MNHEKKKGRPKIFFSAIIKIGMKKRKIIKGQELKKVQKIKSSPDGHLNLIGVKIEFYALF